jgi:hypothetical protein
LNANVIYFYSKIAAMKYFLSFIFLLTIATACKQKVLTGPELEKKLKETMQKYLDKTANPGVHFKVKDVTYFTDSLKKQYNCEFHVEMLHGSLDTTGVMTADIPNNFKEVKRKQ